MIGPTTGMSANDVNMELNKDEGGSGGVISKTNHPNGTSINSFKMIYWHHVQIMLQGKTDREVKRV